uniref:Transmembrane protein n=1 Tax=Angiostrongylus cantonensis TaxID=6313 RepID=A0A158P6M1_ANGCA
MHCYLDDLRESELETALEALSNYDYSNEEEELMAHFHSNARNALQFDESIVVVSFGQQVIVLVTLYIMLSVILVTFYPERKSLENTEAVQTKLNEEAELLTALSYIVAQTALSEMSTYSQYSLPPSETNVEIEHDIIAEASPLSTALSGSVSWYSIPSSETEIEIPPTLYLGGIRVADSLDCLHRLPYAELRPVENFDNPNVRLICTGNMSSEKDSDDDNYEYSYYSDGPSETKVTMSNMDATSENDAFLKASLAKVGDPQLTVVTMWISVAALSGI